MAIRRVSDYFKKGLLGAGILLSLYAALGAYVFPQLFKYKLPDILQQETGLKVLISEVKFQPFQLLLNIQGVQVLEPSAQVLIAFDELSVDLGLFASIKQMGLVLDEVILKKPIMNVFKNKAGVLNLKSILKSTSEKNPVSGSNIFPYAITQLSIQEGEVFWADLQADQTNKEEFTGININLKNLANVGDTLANIDGSLAVKSGGNLHISSAFNLFNQSAEGHVSLNQVHLKSLASLNSTALIPVIFNGYVLLETDFSLKGFSHDAKLHVKNGAVQLKDFNLQEKDQPLDLISLPKFSVTGLDINFKQKTLCIKSIFAEGGNIQTSLEPDGRLNYEVLLNKLRLLDKTTPAANVSSNKESEKLWDIKVASVDLINFGLDFDDKTLKTPVKLKLQPIKFNVTDYSNMPFIKTPIQILVGINNQGSIKLQGNSVTEPFALDGDVNVENIDLENFQAYYEKLVHLDVIDGALNMQGKLIFAKLDQDRPDIQFMGDVEIARLLTRDQVVNKDFVKWESMALKGMVIDYNANQYSAKALMFEKPYLRIAIRKDKTANFSDILVLNKTPSLDKEKVSESKVALGNIKKPIFNLGRVQIKQGTSDFSDMSLILPFEAQIQSLDGGATGISSEQNSIIKMALKGSAYDLAPVDIKGEMSPYLGSYHAKVNFKGLPMPLVTPYMVQFSGYKVEKGKMTLGLNYKVANSDLSATNNLLIDQFELGEQVENPNAVSLPIKLAVALLKDAQGRIKIDVPISGSLDDPQFSLGGVVADALYNGLSNLVTSPFTTLGLLIGSEKDLNLINFEAGSASLSQVQKDKLSGLAKALRTRPNLNLEIKGAAYQIKDWPFIRQDALYEQLKRRRAVELNKNAKKRIRDEYVKLSDDDYKRLLADLFIEKFPKLAKRSFLGEEGLLESNTGDFYQVAKESLLTLIKPEPERLKTLATNRAQAVANFLVHQGGIPAENIYLLDAVVDFSENDQEIVTVLSLNAN